MATSKPKKYKVIANAELQTVLKGFVPVFGSDEDLSIVNRIFALNKKLESVDNKILRGLEKGTELTKKMKDIKREEQWLTDAITKRNNDF